MSARPDAARDVLSEASSRALSAHADLAQSLSQLSARPLGQGSELQRRIEAREDAIVELGRAALCVLLAGGELHTHLGSPGEERRRPPARAVTPQPTSQPVVVRKRASPPSARRRVVADSSTTTGAATVHHLAGHSQHTSWTPRAVESTPEAWSAATQVFGAPPEVPDIVAYDQALRRLVKGVQVDQWRAYPRELQKCLIGYASSLARFLQDEAGPRIGLPEPPHELATMFSVMTRYSDMERPGFVSGLSRRNPPDHGSWANDTAWWWGRLEQYLAASDPSGGPSRDEAWASLMRLLVEGADEEGLVAAVKDLQAAGVSSDDKRLLDTLLPHAHLLAEVGELKTLRKKLSRMADDEDEVVEEEDRSSPIPEDWPLRDRTSGKVGVLLGGEPRPRALSRLKEAFDFEELTWEVADGRRAQALADRVRRSGVDIVIVLRRFVSHKLTDVVLPACRAAEVPFVMVDTGYGVAQTRLALERYLS